MFVAGISPFIWIGFVKDVGQAPYAEIDNDQLLTEAISEQRHGQPSQQPV